MAFMGRSALAAVSLMLSAGLATGCGGGGTTVDDAPDGGAEGGLSERLDEIVATHGVASVSAGVMRGGVLVEAAARGWAEYDSRPATTDTIYGLASVSKPIVGLAAAILADEDPDFDLDADVDDWLEWDPPLAHPGHPDTPVTLRMLLDHTSGIVTDGPDAYETYPKPDPDTELGAFLQPLLGDPDYWADAPGEVEEYSNLGVALAGLVIEKAAGMNFRRYCETRIFEPLGMDDTRWFYADLSPEQQARHAIPHDADREPYAIYGFNDYPSGLLRSTVPDFARLMAALADGGRLDGEQALPAAAVRRFHDETLSIDGEADGDEMRFEHSGGETGVTTFFVYRTDGAGYVYLVNADLDDDPTEALEAALDDALGPAAGL